MVLGVVVLKEGWAGMIFGLREREQAWQIQFPSFKNGNVSAKFHSQFRKIPLNSREIPGNSQENLIPIFGNGNANGKLHSHFWERECEWQIPFPTFGTGIGGRYSREFPGSGIPAHGCLQPCFLKFHAVCSHFLWNPSTRQIRRAQIPQGNYCWQKTVTVATAVAVCGSSSGQGGRACRGGKLSIIYIPAQPLCWSMCTGKKNSLFFGPISNDPGSLHSCYREKSIFPSYKAKLNLTLFSLTNLIIDAYSD